jgi:ABC-type thiamin/hydroxymethylpyrimidine transport system permease subunit
MVRFLLTLEPPKEYSYWRIQEIVGGIFVSVFFRLVFQCLNLGRAVSSSCFRLSRPSKLGGGWGVWQTADPTCVDGHRERGDEVAVLRVLYADVSGQNPGGSTR